MILMKILKRNMMSSKIIIQNSRIFIFVFRERKSVKMIWLNLMKTIVLHHEFIENEQNQKRKRIQNKQPCTIMRQVYRTNINSSIHPWTIQSQQRRLRKNKNVHYTNNHYPFQKNQKSWFTRIYHLNHHQILSIIFCDTSMNVVKIKPNK